MFYNGVAVTAGQVITGFNPALLSFTGIAVGSTSLFFNYAFIDAAGKQDPTPATYTLEWNGIVPISLVNFDNYVVGCNTKLYWKTGEEINFMKFEVERSTDNGNTFTKIAQINSTGSNSNYAYVDNTSKTGKSFYRLKLLDNNGFYKYSNISLAVINCNEKQLIITYPNPANDIVKIIGLNIGDRINLFNIDGKQLEDIIATNNKEEIIMLKYPNGSYVIQISNINGIISTSKLIKEK